MNKSTLGDDMRQTMTLKAKALFLVAIFSLTALMFTLNTYSADAFFGCCEKQQSKIIIIDDDDMWDDMFGLPVPGGDPPPNDQPPNDQPPNDQPPNDPPPNDQPPNDPPPNDPPPNDPPPNDPPPNDPPPNDPPPNDQGPSKKQLYDEAVRRCAGNPPNLAGKGLHPRDMIYILDLWWKKEMNCKQIYLFMLDEMYEIKK